MSKGLFVTATGTDVGKTYITALLIKALRKANLNCGYYKAAASGSKSIAESDAGYVNRMANILQTESDLLSYLYQTPVSPHLAAKLEGNPVCLKKVKADYMRVLSQYDYVITEGSGGIICPIRWDDTSHILLEDIVTMLSLPTIIVAHAGLGAINAAMLTVTYLKQKQIPINGIILNFFNECDMHLDNLNMIETLSGIHVIATVKKGDTDIFLSPEKIISLFS